MKHFKFLFLTHTDIDMGNVLELITTNFLLNLSQINAKYLVKEIDFFKNNWKTDLSEELHKIDTILGNYGF